MKKISMLRTALLLWLFLLFSTMSKAQDLPVLDEVPHDIAYLRASKVSTPTVKVLYGRPALKNEQEKLTDKLTYGNLWRTGANEATEIKFYKDVIFGGTQIKAGTYVLYSIPGEEEWEIILNSEVDTWGAFQYNPAANVARVKISVKKAERVNVFSIRFKDINNDTKMVLAWDQTRIYIPIDGVKDEYFAKL